MATINKLAMLHFGVTDMDKMKAFYTDNLGFTAANDVGQGVQRWVTLAFAEGGPSIVFTTYASNLKPGSMQLYLGTADVEAAYQELKAKGVQVNGEIEKDNWGQRFHVTDPEGNHLVITKG